MIIDAIVLAVLLISAIIAALRGFIREILTILGMVGATLAAVFGGPKLAPIIEGWFGADPEGGWKLFGMIPLDFLAAGIAYGGIFVLVIFSLSLVSHLMAESAKSLGLGPADRALGVVFGLARGVFVLALLYLPFHILLGADAKAGIAAGSKTHPYLEMSAGWMQAMIPSDVKDDITGQAEDLADKAKEVATEQAAKTAQEQAESEDGAGYTEEFRAEMDRMFTIEEPDGGNE